MKVKMEVFAGWMDRDSGQFISKENGAVGDGFDTEPVYEEYVEDLLRPCNCGEEAGPMSVHPWTPNCG